MAEDPKSTLIFKGTCPDCGERQVELPPPLPEIGDDFDWQVRDFDSIRRFMLEELAARFPERTRWTAADMEVVLVEVLAAVLDQLSDMLDRVSAEAYLASARRPESVRRLLKLIGYDALVMAPKAASIPDPKASFGETPEAKKNRLRAFLTDLKFHIDDYEGIIVTELTSLQRENLQAFIAAPTDADPASLDAMQHFLDHAPSFVEKARQNALYRFWNRYRSAMEEARQAGPRAIRTQRRMVTVEDYAARLEEHPLVRRAHAWSAWSGSWTTIHVAVVLWNNLPLDQPLPHTATQLAELAQLLDTTPERLTGQIAGIEGEVDAFHRERGLDTPDWGSNPALRTVLRNYIEAYRMVGQEALLQDAVTVGISMAISLRMADTYFQSEVRRAAARALGMGPGGFFASGRLRFGEDLHAGDIFQTLMALDGVNTVCLNRFKKVGRRYPDQADSGRIILEGLEIAVCDNDPRRPERGYFTLILHGGRKG